MTAEDVLRLKAEAVKAEAAAREAKADAEANPTNQAKAEEAKEADLKATEAWRKYRLAENELPPVSPSDWRVIFLGVYLAITLLGSVYLLAIMSKAAPPEKTIGDLRIECCGKDDKDCAPTPTPTPTATPTPTPEAASNSANNSANISAVNGSASGENTDQANANASANANQTANGNSNQAANKPKASASPATSPKASPSATINAASDQTLPENTIPAIVCVEHFGRMTADGFLFYIVLFAGMVGAVTRGVFSFVRHHGSKDFSFNWTWFYLFLPFSGAVVSLLLYFIIRGGFYGSPIGRSLVLNLFAFVALGTLSGLFSENAMEKLRQVAEVLLTKVPAKVENPQEAEKKKKAEKEKAEE